MCRGTRTNALHESAGDSPSGRVEEKLQRLAKNRLAGSVVLPLQGRTRRAKRKVVIVSIQSRLSEGGGLLRYSMTWGIMFGFGSPVVDQGFGQNPSIGVSRATGDFSRVGGPTVSEVPRFRLPLIRPGFLDSSQLPRSFTFTGHFHKVNPLPRLHACILPCRLRARKHIGDQFPFVSSGCTLHTMGPVLFSSAASHREPVRVA